MLKPHIKYGCLLFLILASGKIIHAQEITEEKVFTKGEITASTDPKLWKAHIQKQSVLPDSLIRKLPEGNYSAVVKFIIDKHGSIGQVTLVQDPGHGLGKRAVRIINSYKGRWTPANQCGRNVTAYREEVIVFKVRHEDSIKATTLSN